MSGLDIWEYNYFSCPNSHGQCGTATTGQTCAPGGTAADDVSVSEQYPWLISLQNSKFKLIHNNNYKKVYSQAAIAAEKYNTNIMTDKTFH